MKKILHFALLALFCVCTLSQAGVTRLTCVGDSITFGAGTGKPATDSYPAQLQRMLGDTWAVSNFGVSGATLLKAGDKPYTNLPAFKKALESKPDVVVIMLGTNDTKPQNWKHKEQFAADYQNLIQQFRALIPQPRIFVCRPVTVPGNGNFGINNPSLQELLPILDEVAKSQNVGLINVHGAFIGKDELLPDRVHPSTAGATLLAETVRASLTAQ